MLDKVVRNGLNIKVLGGSIEGKSVRSKFMRLLIPFFVGLVVSVYAGFYIVLSVVQNLVDATLLFPTSSLGLVLSIIGLGLFIIFMFYMIYLAIQMSGNFAQDLKGYDLDLLDDELNQQLTLLLNKMSDAQIIDWVGQLSDLANNVQKLDELGQGIPKIQVKDTLASINKVIDDDRSEAALMYLDSIDIQSQALKVVVDDSNKK